MGKIFLLFLLTLFLVFTFVIVSVFQTEFANADSVSTSVTVGNTPPVIQGDPAENPVSDGTTPTDVGSNVTFEVTATDSNNENFYMAVCKSDTVTPVNGGAPTCGGGNWCISTSTPSGNEASCSYTVQASDLSETYNWYVFVCDGNSSDAECSTPGDTGSGSSGSPFNVNHPPTFNTISNDGPKNPGQNVTFSTNASTLDDDGDPTDDTVKLIVCNSSGLTGDTCNGTQLCASAFVANNPSCQYLIPTPTADTSYNAYVYLIDNHELQATGINNGSNSSYSVNNVAPVVSNVIVNGGVAIDLTEGTTETISITADVTDNNGCGGGELVSVQADFYRSALGATSCNTNAEDDYDDCYALNSCVVGSCTGAGADYTCDVDVKYHADPTDTSTEFDGQTFKSTVTASDEALSDDFESVGGVTMNSLTALDVTSSINYGAVDVGTNTGNLDQTTTVTATGNVGIDQELSGTNMVSGGNNIAVNKQRYDLSEVLYSAATGLSATATEVEINVPKTRSTGVTTVPGADDTWWGIEIPNGTVAGVYTGTNTVTAIKGETVGW